MDRDGAEDGFTLVEMLLVVALLAIMAGLVMARANPDRSASALSAQLRDYLHQARAIAILHGRVVVLELNPATGQLSGPSPLGTLAIKAGLSLDLGASLDKGLTFQPDGSSAGGILHILRRGTPGAMPDNGLVVAPLTGAITALP